MKSLDIKKTDVPYPSVLTGIQQFTDFSRLFFSRQNIDWLQSNLRYELYKQIGYDIGLQDEYHLIVIMRSVFLEGSRNPVDIREYTENIMLLNREIIKRQIPKLMTAVLTDKKYQNDKLKNRKPLDRPVNASIKGMKTLRSPSEVMNIDTLN